MRTAAGGPKTRRTLRYTAGRTHALPSAFAQEALIGNMGARNVSAKSCLSALLGFT